MVHCNAAAVTGLLPGPALTPLISAVAGWDTGLPPVRLSVSSGNYFFGPGVLRFKHRQCLDSVRPILSKRSKNLIRFCSESDGLQTGGGDSASSREAPQETIVFRANREELTSSLATLTALLSTLSTTITQISSTVQQIARVIEGDVSPHLDASGQGSTAAVVYGAPALAPNEADGAISHKRDPGPWDSLELGRVASAEPGPRGVTTGSDDSVEAQMLEQNSRAHKLAYQLQQAFVQARIEGLGKPFQLAIDDFAETCREAHTAGIGLNELQLQLLLAEGSLTGAFAVRSQQSSKDPIMDEERRVRSSWVRLVYATLAEVAQMQSGGAKQPYEEHDKQQDMDPIDVFVKQAVKMALEEGYDLDRIKLEQTYTESSDIPKAIKMMRQSQYLVVLTLEKALGQRK